MRRTLESNGRCGSTSVPIRIRRRDFCSFVCVVQILPLFDRPAAADATICSWIGNEWQHCQSIGEQDVVEFHVATASRGITFTVDTFPVVGASYDADPADAPLLDYIARR